MKIAITLGLRQHPKKLYTLGWSSDLGEGWWRDLWLDEEQRSSCGAARAELVENLSGFTGKICPQE